MAVVVAANVAPMVKASKRTARLASTAPVLSFNATDAVPNSPPQNVAADNAALFDAAHSEPAAGTTEINRAGIVAGVTVTVTVEVAAALSVTVSVTGVSAATLFGVKVNVAPVTVDGTASTVGLFELTRYGPTPPVIPTVLAVLPNALNVDGAAASELPTAAGVDELEPPQLASDSNNVEAIVPRASLPIKV